MQIKEIFMHTQFVFSLLLLSFDATVNANAQNHCKFSENMAL